MKKYNFITKTLVPCIFMIVFYSILIPIITSIVITPKAVLNTKQKEKIALAGIEFLNESKEDALPVSAINNNYQPDFVTVDNLIHQGYLNDVELYTNQECNYDLSYIQHEIIEPGKNQYQLYMFCNNNLETLTLSD
ncbi:MAG: hypothetical protein PHS45_02445 [Bacilli bacterium]|nr:hypothetical protein [Bacilli bacterium]